MDQAKRMWRIIRGRSISNEWRRKAFYLKHEFPGEIHLRKDSIFFNKLNLEISVNTFGFILGAYNKLRLIAGFPGVIFAISDSSFIIRIGDVQLSATTEEEIFIIQEIFFEGTYNFLTFESCIVIDVGMNVGFASLFFANNSSVKKVYSFEPFETTYRQAQVNFALNPKLSGKIMAFQFGLSDRNEELKVAYDYENKGQVGIHGTRLIRSSVRGSEDVAIDLKRASFQISEIIDRHPEERNMVLKLDCEGAEYAIIEDLASARVLERIHIIFIEWHEEGPDRILDALKRHRFTAFFQQSVAKKVGMIYAVR